MKLIVIKVNPDIINGGANSIEVGIFEDNNSQPTIRLYVPKYNLARYHGELKVGQELKLVPAENNK